MMSPSLNTKEGALDTLSQVSRSVNDLAVVASCGGLAEWIFCIDKDACNSRTSCEVVPIGKAARAYLLGLLAQIKCSICSYQYDN